ncbi:ABATE domain-containing protein [Actinomadura barringtoniae]|uniref:ABATE domain-containing protein n=1 Tax=Actinomadura barringtoniae TaxID=1427535 RepID=A0A939PKZ2_9ACTN|nr:ABATE domain-containing protein [Actinomadura barringtoniae]
MEFTFVSGDVALDLAGTVMHRRSPARQDVLTAPADLTAWIAAAGLLTTAPDAGAADLAAAVRLREAIYRSALNAAHGEPPAPADADVINRAAAAPPPAPALTTGADGPGVRREGDIAGALAAAARAAVELLGGPDARHIKECQSGDCTRLYLDLSRRQSRRWCDMSGCGNRAKAAAFRARHK